LSCSIQASLARRQAATGATIRVVQSCVAFAIAAFGSAFVGLLALPSCDRQGLQVVGPPDAATDLAPVRQLSLLAGGLRIQGYADGIGSEARFSGPLGLAASEDGYLFVADSGNHVVRGIDLSTGMVLTIAGDPEQPGSADGVGKAGLFREPWGLAYDPSGLLLVADRMNSTIRKIELASGKVTTLAGMARVEGSSDGVGATARFYGPTDVAVDGRGNIFIADHGNSTIRKLMLSTAEVTTLAGKAGIQGSMDGVGGSASFYFPIQLVVSGDYLFVSDAYTDVIRRVAISTAVVATVAGVAGQSGSSDGTGPAARFWIPEGLAVDRIGSLFIADAGNSTVRRLGIATGAVTTIVGVAGQPGVKLGAVPGGLYFPSDVAVLPENSGGGLAILDAQESVVLVLQ
jgi:hypothetical protein